MKEQFLLSVEHPILQNHKAFGQELLPGPAYIDMMYQIFREHGYDYNELELCNVSIYNPLVVGQDFNVMVSIQCEEVEEGHWKIVVEGQEKRNQTLSDEKKRYITAEMRRVCPITFEETLDLQNAKQQATQSTSLEQAYEQFRALGLVHTGFMKAIGSTFHAESGVLVNISLDGEALVSASDVMFHPTLIDASCVGAAILLSSLVHEENQLFLPIFFESFRGEILVQENCVTRVQSSSVKRKNEVLSMTLEIFNQEGKKVAEVANYTMKIVRRAELNDSAIIEKSQTERGLSSLPLSGSDSNPIIDPNSVTGAEAFLRQLLAKRLDKPEEEIDSYVGYYEMGLDSPGLLEVVKAIETKVEESLPPTLLFEYTTIADLSVYLMEKYASQFNELDSSEKGIDKRIDQSVLLNSAQQWQANEPETTAQMSQEAQSQDIEEEIAIIGMAGRFPKSNNLEEFWTNLKAGKDCISEVPQSRWDWKQFEGLTSPSGKSVSKWGGFIDDPDCFDAQFFRISPREAEIMDPQERLFLETCWEAIEDAGYKPSTLVTPKGPNKRNHVGVFAGVMHKDYALLGSERMSQGQLLPLSLSHSYIANRVSYFCNFHGPSLAIDTLCSASLTAVHMALESIKRKECEVALAGGVNLSLHPDKYKTLGIANMHSSDGYCRTFGKEGDGYVSAEGTGAVLLKPLRKAIQDGDHIYAVIKGSAVNHVGTVSGITVPSPVAQADLIATCLEKTGIHPRTISYIEAHGTGTSLGDPIEIQGLVKAFQEYTQDRQYCSIGSVKSNVGHGESAAGICGLIKVALQLHHKTLVPSLHSEEINPFIDFTQSPFYVQHQTKEWKQPVLNENEVAVSYPRRAGLSSFGAYGSNAHIILEEFIPREEQLSPIAGKSFDTFVVPLSAKNEERLRAYVTKLHRYLAVEHSAKSPQSSQEMQDLQIWPMLTAKIKKMLSEIIQVEEDEIENEQEWNEYGIEIAHLTKVKEEIQKDLLIDMEVSELIQMGSIASVTAYLTDHHRDKLITSELIPSDSPIAVTKKQKEFLPEKREINLVDLAYTLQIGREAMEERVVFVVQDLADLIEKLEAFSKNIQSIEQCWEGRIQKNKDNDRLKDAYKLISQWIAQGNYALIAESWAKGLNVDWNLLYGECKPQRIQLPTYPFAKNRYWLPELVAKPQHPLPDQVSRATVQSNLDKGIISNLNNDSSEQSLHAEDSLVGTLMLTPVWDAVAVREEQSLVPAVSDRIVMIGGEEHARNALQTIYPNMAMLDISTGHSIEEIERMIKEYGSIDHILCVAPNNQLQSMKNETYLNDQKQDVLLYFRIIKALLLLGYGSKNLGLSIITTQAQPISKNDAVNPAHASIHGLMGSLAKEYPNWKIRLIDMEAGCEWPLISMLTLPVERKGGAWVYRDGEWHRLQLIPSGRPSATQSMYRQKGVYVVIGGAGGVGEIWSEYMIHNYQAQIIWIGRRQVNDGIRTKIDRLAGIGPDPYYIAADASDRNALQQAYAEIKQKFGQIHGVVHSAMVLSEKRLADMQENEFNAALSAKVDVSVRMAQVFSEEPLDFVLFFSSLISFIKNPEQSHYASGCTFKDAFAHELALEWPCTVRVMNWGFWANAEVESLEQYQMLHDMGIGLIEPEDGMKALEMLLTESNQQMALMKTTKPIPVENMNPKEYISILTGNTPSSPSHLLTRMDTPDLLIQQLKAEKSEQAQVMNDLLSKLLFVQLQEAGVFTEKISHISQMRDKAEPNGAYERWLEESFSLLINKGFLQKEKDFYTITAPKEMSAQAVWKEWGLQTRSWREDSNSKAQVVLVETMLRVLPDILAGSVPATDVIFPNSSMSLVEGIYKNNVIADYYNNVLADAAVAYLQERLEQDPTAQISILEIGAGTGGTSATVFQKLEPYQSHIKEYCYTDLSKAFFMHAQKEYGPKNPFLTYQLFNVEKPLWEQDIRSGKYDLVIAANVLHATKNIRQTLRNAKATLKKNGWLLINEISENAIFTHLTFGLLEGWWLYDDPDVRIPGCPGLYPETWQTLLEREGFDSVLFFAQENHDLGQQIIAAKSDGIIRQTKRSKSIASSSKKSIGALERQEANNSKVPTADKSNTTNSASANVFGVTEQMLQDHVRELISENLAQTLKLDIKMIDFDDSFADYGLDSISGVHLVNTLNEMLKTDMKTTVLFDYSSVNQLTNYILSDFKDAVSASIGQEMIPTESLDAESKGYQVASSEAEELVDTDNSVQKEPIAIIGMSGRFAKSNTVDELWEHLANGEDLIEEVTRWDLSSVSNRATPYCNHGSFIDNIDQFDPLFFNISGFEATYMDPQQRIFLEESWKALEDAGYAGDGINGRLCGVYVGYNIGDYVHLIGDDSPAQAMWGNAPSIIPARIAYYLNLQGPAVTVDTACSSSLVAIHLACQSLWTRETEMALAGGVFIQSTPAFYINSNRAGMLSPTGRCHTFDNRADGFVPGEGAGVVVLKRLKDAIADGDHIYGVIRGSAINQDGTTNGITAPSANSQERLERYVYDTFDVHPERIQMVEAHGTGTRLGDPIEFEALTRAFRHYTDQKQYCSIGSIKTNIGHVTAAAGVAGVIKILLSLRHKQIPPSLHYVEGNTNIQFAKSPFYVNTDLREWEIEENSKRCAVTSAFGFSGTNAHMVIEEAPHSVRIHQQQPGYLLVLSARSYEQLCQQVRQLLIHCECEHHLDLGNISYTLLLGRKHLNHRLACVVRSVEELIKLLSKWLNRGKMAQIYVSELLENKLREQPSLKRYGNQCIQNSQTSLHADEYLENLSTIGELYVQGYTLQYEELFANDLYSRIPLPTYPFAKERYWVAEGNRELHVVKNERAVTIESALHSLLHRNTSDFTEQRFSSRFTGKEFFVKDHILNRLKVLPEVIYLEMARAGVEIAAGIENEEDTTIRLKDITWVRPIVVGTKSEDVHIGLYPQEDGDIGYEIYTDSQLERNQKVIHSQGKAVLVSRVEAQKLDVIDLQAQCSREVISDTQWYQALTAAGLNYGAGYRSMKALYVGDDQILAELSLPQSFTDSIEQYVLHPGLVDAALQASVGLYRNLGNTALENCADNQVKVILPISLQELEILGPCVSQMWAWIRSSDVTSLQENVQMIDIDICDQKGNVCVRLRGVSSRIVGVESHLLNASPSDEYVLPTSFWEEYATVLEENASTDENSEVTLGELENGQAEKGKNTVSMLDKNKLLKKATNYFLQMLSSFIKMPTHRIDEEAPLDKYGIDSIMVVQLTNELEKDFGSLSKTLFFEYQNMREVSEYFLENHRERLLELLNVEEHSQVNGMKVTEAINSANPANSSFISDTLAKSIKSNPKVNRFASISTERRPEGPQESQDIAIIGVSGQYPGASNVEQFWNNLRDGIDSITEIPVDRWNHDLYYDSTKGKPGKTYCKWGGFLDSIDQFDPLFFNISPLEAEIVDPKDRLFLETVWNVMESVGYTKHTINNQYQGKVGVYVGATYQHYHLLNTDKLKDSLLSLSSSSSIANRVSHFFNFQGPSIAVDTMCSSSAIAIHMACESLKKGECKLAIAGGVNLSLHPNKYIGLSLLQLVGSHPESRSFGSGDGYLPAEGVGAVLLKPLAKAIEDNDPILAVIKSTAVNHGGRTNGYGVPNPNAQAQLIEDNFKKAGIDPATISYIESAANGSALGDAIEITALRKVFKKTTNEKTYPIGSVKSNIGHAEAASGISQLTKLILQLKYQQLVPSIKADPLNPNIRLEDTPFYIQRELEEWKRPVIRTSTEERELPRRAVLSSFGAGGSNAHIIVEEYIAPKPEESVTIIENTPQMIVLSAKNKNRLQESVRQMLQFIKDFEHISLADLAFTLQTAREAMETRLAIIAANREELIIGLQEYLFFTEFDRREEFTLPIYTGDLGEQRSEIKHLLSGKTGEMFLQVMVAELDLEKLGLYWTNGGEIPWEMIHQNRIARKISLPTYPFQKRHCWVETRHESVSVKNCDRNHQVNSTVVIPKATEHSMKAQVLGIISRLLGMEPSEIHMDRPLQHYGVSSIHFIQFLQQLQTQVNASVHLMQLQDCRTVQEILDMLVTLSKKNSKGPQIESGTLLAEIWTEFPELVRLNKGVQGRPVFWIHGSTGGVEVYKEIAQYSQRPFYGIQARGWMNDSSPLHGIYEMATYYVKIIRSVQPKGPYDLGGYSLGGLLAYEVTRQLQVLGENVDTLVMLDTYYDSEIQSAEISTKSQHLQTINIALVAAIPAGQENSIQSLIHRDELDCNADDETFLDQLIVLAQERGITVPKDQLKAQIQQNVKIQKAFELKHYTVSPLLDPHGVTCYYFRNKSELFLGELEPYFVTEEDSISWDHLPYWKGWMGQLPNLNLVDVDSPNHMFLLAEPNSLQAIIALCEKLYATENKSF
ncbi:SDR family NAD(P)-dependent oxidoreductase [Brevibacillus laterosporus]|uniref:SDR family NAD(P)-dependent oxidoreductase n=1 Tax=Brevibacillus laterosporus TaxID=1465 RepID=UPI002852BF60|nr:SDR family NAD(P)-dependent oxidoreductase [Brevibacillus laterosporus]